jgi:ferredoxin, 2Fe-2S
MKITVINDGKQEIVEAAVGDTLMEAIPNLFGDCGGNCVCATCHVKILSDHQIEMDELAQFTLDLAENVEYNSRLSCQVVLDDSMNGLIVKVMNI